MNTLKFWQYIEKEHDACLDSYVTGGYDTFENAWDGTKLEWKTWFIERVLGEDRVSTICIDFLNLDSCSCYGCHEKQELCVCEQYIVAHYPWSEVKLMIRDYLIAHELNVPKELL